MIPIIVSGEGGGVGHSFEEFQRNFMAICKSHRADNRALAFVFILYDFDHPEIRKVLHDQDYWDALNHISGHFLTVFSFHLSTHAPRKARGSLAWMTKVDSESLSGPRKFIHEKFAVDLQESRPVLLFFQVINDAVSHPYLVEVKADTVEDAFREIRDVLHEAVGSVKGVRPEFRQNSAEIFNLIRSNLAARKSKLAIKSTARALGSVADLIGTLTGMSGK